MSSNNNNPSEIANFTLESTNGNDLTSLKSIFDSYAGATAELLKDGKLKVTLSSDELQATIPNLDAAFKAQAAKNLRDLVQELENSADVKCVEFNIPSFK